MNQMSGYHTTKARGGGRLRRYSDKHFLIMIKKFRAEIRALGIPPQKNSPLLIKMSKFMDVISGIKDVCTPGAISAQLIKNLCNAHVILGMRRVGKDSDAKLGSTWTLMNDEEYILNYYDEDVDLSPDDMALLTAKGLNKDFQIDEVILKNEIDDPELRSDPLETPSASEHDFSGDCEPSDDLLIPMPSAPKKFKAATPDTFRSKPKINYNELLNQRKQRVALEEAGVLRRAKEVVKNTNINKMDELAKKVEEYESDPDWLFCKSLCAQLKDLTVAEKNNIKFELLQVASKNRVELLLAD